MNTDGTYYTQVNTANDCTNTSGFVTYSGTGSFAAPVAVGDLNGDGKNDIVAAGRWSEGTGSNNGSLYAWPGAGSASAWPTFHHDAQHTGRVGSAVPQLAVSPQGITVVHQVGTPGNEQATLQIRESGVGSFDWSATAPSGVTLSPSSGTTSSSVNSTATISTASRPLGVYNLGNIVVTARVGGNPVAGSPVSVPVTLMMVNQLYRLFSPWILK